MRAAIFNAPGSVTAGKRPDAAIVAPTDAVVRVLLACVCGSDLWYHHGEAHLEPGPIGHEFIGVGRRCIPRSTRRGRARWSATSACRTASSCRSSRCSAQQGRPRRRRARAHIPALLGDVLDGRIDPGRVFDLATGLEDVGEAYAAMDERRAIKSLLRVGTL